eukprot:TRINITY_DN5952_c0_g1_i1.p1 TRINITY_DN5952_c0_g1~~TRINITY_DN5952_c0_g1_i1.p1  ORF type:complete len:134 (+),score=17.50 TRINITY_DN5952_c0_g1_i1:57-458(+)
MDIIGPLYMAASLAWMGVSGLVMGKGLKDRHRNKKLRKRQKKIDVERNHIRLVMETKSHEIERLQNRYAYLERSDPNQLREEYDHLTSEIQKNKDILSSCRMKLIEMDNPEYKPGMQPLFFEEEDGPELKMGY